MLGECLPNGLWMSYTRENFLGQDGGAFQTCLVGLV